MWRYTYNLRGLYETPMPPGSGGGDPGRARAQTVIEAARHAGRTLLTEHESKQVLAAYGIPTIPSILAATPEEAVAAAEQLGYPADTLNVSCRV
jgi:acetyltransferase